MNFQNRLFPGLWTHCRRITVIGDSTNTFQLDNINPQRQFDTIRQIRLIR